MIADTSAEILFGNIFNKLSAFVRLKLFSLVEGFSVKRVSKLAYFNVSEMLLLDIWKEFRFKIIEIGIWISDSIISSISGL